jgi:integrase
LSKSTRRPSSRKATDRPKKPYPDFPLTPHASGAWQKKIRGKIYYFCRWARRVNGKLERIDGDGWKEALELYKAQADDLHAGRTPRVKNDGLTLADLCNRFLTAKHHKLASGEVGSRMFQEYREITDLIVAAFGKTRFVDDLAADDFEALRAQMAERWGPVRLGNAITRVKSVFKYALDNGLLDRPPRFGSEFKKPDKAVLRRHRATNGEKMLEAGELRRLLATAGVPLRAMILLGINCGFGNADCGNLPLTALDLDAAWVNFPRPKTGIARRCYLWSETVAALREVIAMRPAANDPTNEAIVFLQPSGKRWVRLTEKSRRDNVSGCFGELMKKLGMHRAGLNFYTLRHTFRTVADAARDPVAIDLIMGHTDSSMGSHYRERVEDSRLVDVAEHVRKWLFGEAPDGDATGAPNTTTLETSDSCEPGHPLQQDKREARPILRLFAG